MLDNPLLTVIVTSYNYEKYIPETLDSLVNQTEQNFKIIVIDDGSKDNSVSIIKEYAQKYENILFLQHEGGINKGLSKSMQVALFHVNTEYVAFCESDDYWDTNHVEKLLHYIKSQPQNMNMIFNKLVVKNYSDNKEYDGYVDFSNKALNDLSGSNIFHLMISNYMPTFSSACIKTEELRKCDFNSYYAPYLDFWLWRQLCVNNNIYYADEPITYWRKHNESYDMKENNKNITPFLIASNDLILSKIKRKVPLYERIKLAFFSIILRRKKFIKQQMKIISKYADKEQQNA